MCILAFCRCLSSTLIVALIRLGKCGLGKLDVTGNPLKDLDLKKEMASGDAAVIAYIRLKLQRTSLVVFAFLSVINCLPSGGK